MSNTLSTERDGPSPLLLSLIAPICLLNEARDQVVRSEDNAGERLEHWSNRTGNPCLEAREQTRLVADSTQERLRVLLPDALHVPREVTSVTSSGFIAREAGAGSGAGTSALLD